MLGISQQLYTIVETKENVQKKQNKSQSGVKGRRKKNIYLSECAPNDAELMSIRNIFFFVTSK